MDSYSILVACEKLGADEVKVMEGDPLLEAPLHGVARTTDRNTVQCFLGDVEGELSVEEFNNRLIVSVSGEAREPRLPNLHKGVQNLDSYSVLVAYEKLGANTVEVMESDPHLENPMRGVADTTDRNTVRCYIGRDSGEDDCELSPEEFRNRLKVTAGIFT